MVIYNIENVTDTMVLGESVFSPNGDLLVAAGYQLKERYRLRLKQLGFTSVYIEQNGTEDILPETVINSHVQREMSASINKSTDGIKNVLEVKQQGSLIVQRAIRDNQNELNKYIMNSGLSLALEKFIEEIMNQNAVMVNMAAMQGANADLLAHVINVTITALCIGKKYKFSYDEMKQLGIGALNYDLGLVALPAEMVDKEEELTEEEIRTYRQHTVYGYLMLSQSPLIPATSSAVALQHHEHQDGSGFPRSLKGQNDTPLKDLGRKNVIHRFAEIVAVADTYDLLTSGRLGLNRHPLAPAAAIRTMIEMGGSRLNNHIVKTLVAIIPLFPVGARVRITKSLVPQLAGLTGAVAKQDPGNLERPLIICYETRNGEPIKPVKIDLGQHPEMVIELIT